MRLVLKCFILSHPGRASKNHEETYETPWRCMKKENLFYLLLINNALHSKHAVVRYACVMSKVLKSIIIRIVVKNCIIESKWTHSSITKGTGSTCKLEQATAAMRIT